MKDEIKNGELMPSEEAQIDLNALIPLGVQLIENSHQQAKAQIELQKDSLRVREEQLRIQKSAFQHKYWLLAVITISLIGIAVGLIFFKNDTGSGMGMLSHVGAVIVGIMAGNGWERMREK